LWIFSNLTSTHVSMMESVSSHLLYKPRVIAVCIVHLLVVIKDVFIQFTLDGLCPSIILNSYTVSCFLNSHVFQLFYYFKARWFILWTFLTLQYWWMCHNIIDCDNFRLIRSSHTRQSLTDPTLLFNHKLLYRRICCYRLCLYNRFWNGLILFSLFKFNKVTLLFVL